MQSTTPTTTVVGHRGNPARHPENSIDGILDARRFATMVEIDVRRTADAVLLLSHDAHVDGKALIDHAATAFPTTARLTDLMDVIGDFPLNIEIKNSPSDPDFDETFETAERIATLARPIDLITAFHWDTVTAVQTVRPDVPTGLLVDRDWPLDAAISAAHAGGHQAIAPHWSLVDDAAGLMRQADGLAVNVWTVNDEDLARRLVAGGISAIITDDPARMTQLIQELNP